MTKVKMPAIYLAGSFATKAASVHGCEALRDVSRVKKEVSRYASELRGAL